MRNYMYTDPVRMKRLSIFLALGTVLSTVAVASQSRIASVNFTYRDTALRGYRIGDEFLLPLESVSELGWSAGSATAGAKITTETSTLNLPTRNVDGKTCIPLRQAIEQLGGISNWISGGYDNLQVSSPIYNITVRNGEFSISSALAVKPTISVVGTRKVMIDLEGAKFTKETHIDADGSTNIIQYGANTVRIVTTLDSIPNLPKNQLNPSAKLKFDLNPEPVVVKPPKVDKPTDTGKPVDTNSKPQDPTPPVDPTKPLEIPIKLDWENETASAISVKFEPGQWKGVATSRKPDKTTLEIVMANLNGFVKDGVQLNSSAIKSVSSRQEGTVTVVTLKLKRAMGVDINSSGTGFTLNLIRPNDTGGKLNGKTIVIDAGHGGRDHGATSGGVMEKDINLFLSKYLREALAAEGMTVITTRTDDSFPELEARPALANKSRADIFISIHANEPGRASNNNPSGTIVFYHTGSTISKFLGECIQNELAKFNLLPNLGVKSDGTIYNSGFAVLRLSSMPGVLIETGFVTNQKDRQVLLSDAFGKALAKSVVAGLKTYYGQ